MSATSLAAVSAFFGVTGMTAIFAAAPVPVATMVAVLEAGKLVTAAWLSRHWRSSPALLRAPLVAAVLALMTLTAIGSYGYLTSAHLGHQAEASVSIARDEAPIAERIRLAESSVADADHRIEQLDAMVAAATKRGRTAGAMRLVSEQGIQRGTLVAARRSAGERLAELKIEQAGIEARRARAAADEGPALYLAKLVGSSDPEAMVRLITALIVLTLDPLAVLLTLAAARGSKSNC